MRKFIHLLVLALALTGNAWSQSRPAAPATQPAAAPATAAPAAGNVAEQILGVGDIVRITVFQNPDLTVEGARISETGQINFPLIGSVAIGGLSPTAAEQKIAKALRDGGFVLRPQVTLQLATIRSNQISVLGQVTKPGRYPIDVVGMKVSEMVAMAGGVLPTGADTVTLVGNRNGKPIRMDIDMPSILQGGRSELDLSVENGDVIFVDRAPTAYIYGEVQKPGQFKLERGMTLMQSLAQAGGLTPRGTQRGIKVHRRDAAGKVEILDVGMNEVIQRDDVIYVKESLF